MKKKNIVSCSLLQLPFSLGGFLASLRTVLWRGICISAWPHWLWLWPGNRFLLTHFTAYLGFLGNFFSCTHIFPRWFHSLLWLQPWNTYVNDATISIFSWYSPDPQTYIIPNALKWQMAGLRYFRLSEFSTKLIFFLLYYFLPLKYFSSYLS